MLFKALRRTFTNQKGAGLVEYLLLLIIGVSLILGLMNQFYRPFGQWLTNYTGSYLQCLLETGELPALGGTTSGECKLDSLKNVAQATSSSPNLKSSSNSSNSSTLNKSQDSFKGSQQTTTSNSRGADSRTRGVDRFSKSSVPVGSVDQSSSGANADGKTSSGGSEFANRRNVGTYGTDGRKRIKVNPSGRFLAGLLEKKSKHQSKVYKIPIPKELLASKSKKFTLMKRTPDKKTHEEEGFSFGLMFRLFIIFLIIFAMIIFFGNQIMQLNRSWNE